MTKAGKTGAGEGVTSFLPTQAWSTSRVFNSSHRSLPASDRPPGCSEQEGWVRLVDVMLGLLGSEDNSPREGHRLAPRAPPLPGGTVLLLTTLWANSQVPGMRCEPGVGSFWPRKLKCEVWGTSAASLAKPVVTAPSPPGASRAQAQ